MHLQSGSRNIRRDRAEAGLVNNIRLFRAVRDQDNLFAFIIVPIPMEIAVFGTSSIVSKKRAFA